MRRCCAKSYIFLALARTLKKRSVRNIEGRALVILQKKCKWEMKCATINCDNLLIKIVDGKSIYRDTNSNDIIVKSALKVLIPLSERVIMLSKIRLPTAPPRFVDILSLNFFSR